MTQGQTPARRAPQQTGQDPRKEAHKTKGYETTKFAGSGSTLLAGRRRTLIRRWFQPVCLWPREDRRKIAEGFA